MRTHVCPALRVLILGTYLYANIISHVYIYRIIDIFAYEPVLCELTFVSALASAQRTSGQDHGLGQILVSTNHPTCTLYKQSEK